MNLNPCKNHTNGFRGHFRFPMKKCVTEQSPDLPNITQLVNDGTEYPGVRAEAVEDETARGL